MLLFIANFFLFFFLSPSMPTPPKISLLTNVCSSIPIPDYLNKIGKCTIYPHMYSACLWISVSGEVKILSFAKMKFYYSFLCFPKFRSQKSLDFNGSKWSMEWMWPSLLSHSC